MIIDTLRRVRNTLFLPFYKITANRVAGLTDEVRYWDKALAGDKFVERLNPNKEIAEPYARCVDKMVGTTVRILDVGAGPLTTMGYRYKDYKIELVPVDPLADAYDKILATRNIIPPVRTIGCAGESLVERFGRDSFEMVIAVNSLDHTDDPSVVIEQMSLVCKKGGYLILSHYENEARTQGYKGLHQWNFALRNGDCLLTGKGKEYAIGRIFKDTLQFEHERDGAAIRSIARKYV